VPKKDRQTFTPGGRFVFGKLIWSIEPLVSERFRCHVPYLTIDTILVWVSALSFAAFGAACFGSSAMQREYQRYGLSKYRQLVGILQLLGAAGLWVGLREPWAGQIASGGLAVLMMLGVGVRLKIRDTLWQTFPAFAYMILNGYLWFAAY
jgi:hypothetical protein